ncbi:hypothetical protein BKA65DRAFT_520054 [Rhexocercosporidium sp. MPI-PUGE-AT-0058]|nr:hypothetical protein BKA65DRAFT_520054 [Rhexocercosporidium sp. MPI-PUGE-AT-0058]
MVKIPIFSSKSICRPRLKNTPFSPFQVYYRPDEVPIMVHEAVLAEQSPALAALMRGEMAESVAGESRWMDVDKGTFVRFAQFAYTGDYSISKGSTAQAVVEAESSSQEPRVLDGWGSSFAPRSSVAPPAPRTSALEPEDE